jgi:hypothetical protein
MESLHWRMRTSEEIEDVFSQLRLETELRSALRVKKPLTLQYVSWPNCICIALNAMLRT